MKRLLPLLVAASGMMAALSSAEAAPWISINERQAVLEERIDRGIRSGALTRAEAIILRGEFRTIAALEADYRRTGVGLTSGERADLDRRFDALAQKIRIQRYDRETKGGPAWIPIREREARIFTRIEEGVRNGALTRPEAIRLRSEFNTIVQLETEYRRSGGVFTIDEREDLDRRLQRLSTRIVIQRGDMQRRY